MKTMTGLIWLLTMIFSIQYLGAQDLSITKDDLRIEQSSPNSGYYLYIRKKPDISSIMLTESTEDPSFKAASYAWRNPNTPPINADEKRILNGAVLENKAFYLVSSTVTDDVQFGKAFKLFIPWVVEYGYPWARFGVVQVRDGTYVSVRSFAKQFADYTGLYKDNPFSFVVKQEKLVEKLPDNYSPETVKTFSLYSKDTSAKSVLSKNPEDTLSKIKDLLKDLKGPSLDLVLCLDNTMSMEDDLPPLQKNLVALLKDSLKNIPNIRISVEIYRDYLEEFLYQLSPPTTDFDQVQKSLDRMKARGGRDLPEAVDEALFGGLKEFEWKAENRMIILIGDAPPHPIPLGSITNEMVRNLAKEKKVQINSIILPGN